MKQEFQSGFVGLLVVAASAAVIVIVASFILPQQFAKQKDPSELSAPSPKIQDFKPLPTPALSTATPAPNGADETANWKTYTGKDFIFKYPSNWMADNNQIYDPSTMFKGGNGGNAVMYKRQLWFTEVPSKQTVDKYVNQYYGNQTGFKTNDITVNNVHGKSFYNPKGEGTFGWYVAFSNGSNIFLFGPAIQDLTQDELFNQILSTFKFLE